MKTLILTLLLASQTLTSGSVSISNLDLNSEFKTKIVYNDIMTLESVQVERVPVNNDPDETPTAFYCLTKVITNVGQITLTGTVENKVLTQEKLPLKAMVLIETADDGHCTKPQFKNDTWYDVSLYVNHEQMIFSGKKQLKEFQLAVSLSSVLGKVIFEQADNGTSMVRGFDLNNGKEVRTISDLELSWAAYYKTSSDTRLILQEQGKLPLSE